MSKKKEQKPQEQEVPAFAWFLIGVVLSALVTWMIVDVNESDAERSRRYAETRVEAMDKYMDEYRDQVNEQREQIYSLERQLSELGCNPGEECFVTRKIKQPNKDELTYSGSIHLPVSDSNIITYVANGWETCRIEGVPKRAKFRNLNTGDIETCR